jgi:hypothetical protein
MFTKSGFHIEGFLAKLVLALLADYQLNPHPPQGNQIARISSIIWVFVPPSRNPVDEWLSSGGLARFQLGLPLLRDQSPLFGRSEKNRKSMKKGLLPACLPVSVPHITWVGGEENTVGTRKCVAKWNVKGLCQTSEKVTHLRTGHQHHCIFTKK